MSNEPTQPATEGVEPTIADAVTDIVRMRAALKHATSALPPRQCARMAGAAVPRLSTGHGAAVEATRAPLGLFGELAQAIEPTTTIEPTNVENRRANCLLIIAAPFDRVA